MSWIDYAIIAICLASAAFGYWRGFVKEAIALVTWLVAILLAWQGAWLVEDRLGEWTAAPELRVWAARAIIFIGVLIVGGLLAWLMRALIRSTGLSSTDRSLGALFGLARGVLLAGLLAIVIGLAELDDESWWAGARLRPFCEQVAEGIIYYAGLGRRYLEGEDPLGVESAGVAAGDVVAEGEIVRTL
ncbi:MAG TPA: CvpA family protein [Gammaproteobacteria bacterium]|nr:CvpA family protein [Gammaproteobacteria bacterium]